MIKWARNLDFRISSGFRRKSAEATIGFFRNHGIGKFLLDLLIYVDGFLRLGLPQNAGKFEQYQRPGNEDELLVREGAVDFYGVVRFAGARIDYGDLVLRHAREFS